MCILTHSCFPIGSYTCWLSLQVPPPSFPLSASLLFIEIQLSVWHSSSSATPLFFLYSVLWLAYIRIIHAPAYSGDTTITHAEMLYITYRGNLTRRRSFLTLCTAAQSQCSQQYINSGPSPPPYWLCYYAYFWCISHYCILSILPAAAAAAPTTIKAWSHVYLHECLMPSEHLVSLCSPTLEQTRESVDYWMQLQRPNQTIKIDSAFGFYHTKHSRG